MSIGPLQTGAGPFFLMTVCVPTCSLQTAEVIPSSFRHPSTSVAIFGQSGESHKYSVTHSSRPSGVFIPVFIVIWGMSILVFMMPDVIDRLVFRK
jgi:hypothetical protein